MTDAAALPTTEPSTNGAGTRQQRLAAAVKNLRTRQSFSSIPVDRWVLIAGAIMVPLGIALILLAWYGAAHKALIIHDHGRARLLRLLGHTAGAGEPDEHA